MKRIFTSDHVKDWFANKVSLFENIKFKNLNHESLDWIRLSSRLKQLEEGWYPISTIFFFNLSFKVNLIEFCLQIPNIGPKVINSVVKRDFRAFEVPSSYTTYG